MSEEKIKGAEAPVDSTGKSSLLSQSEKQLRMKQGDWIEACKEIDALELQSERDALRIAELNAEVERWHSAYNKAHEQAMENGSKLAQVKAERDRYRMDLERIVNGSAPRQRGKGGNEQ